MNLPPPAREGVTTASQPSGATEDSDLWELHQDKSKCRTGKNKNKLRAEFIISTGKLCDDVDQTRGRLRWWGRVESLDVRDLDPPLQIWLFHSEGTLNVYSTILNWFTFKKKKRKEKMEKTSAPCLASAHSCCVWSKDAGVFSALFMTCAVNVWPLVDNEAHWGEQ